MFRLGKCLVKDTKKKSSAWIQCNICDSWSRCLCVGIEYKKLRSDFIFICKLPHKENASPRAILRDDTPTAITEMSLEMAAKEVSHQNQRKSTPESLNCRPNYISHAGNVYHISRFLSLMDGKSYNPMASRNERWKSQNVALYLEKLSKLSVSETTKISIGDFVSTWKKGEGFSHGLVVRMYKKISRSSNHVLLEADNLCSLRVFINVGELDEDQTFTPSTKFNVFEGAQVIATSKLVSGRLVTNEHINCLNEKKSKLAELDKQTKNPDPNYTDLTKNTVPILKDILKKNKIAFNSKDKKLDLIEKIKEFPKKNQSSI